MYSVLLSNICTQDPARIKQPGSKTIQRNAQPKRPKKKAPTATNPQNFHLFPQTSHRQNATISLKSHNPTHPKCARGARGGGGGGTSHRLISTSSLHLIIRNLPLFTLATHKLIRRRHLWCRPLCIKNIHLLQLLILLSPFITRHFRTRHGRQSFYGERARYKVLAERGV